MRIAVLIGVLLNLSLVVNLNGQKVLAPADNKQDEELALYKKALTETKKLNACWQSYCDSTKKNDSAKSVYYGDSYFLTKLDTSNKSIKDTFINGARYVLMVAWKSNSFSGYITKDSNRLTYKSYNQFFVYPLFLASAYDIQQRAKKYHMERMTASECRTRLAELLGLPPTSSNDIFVEFWVRTSDLFRPAIDSSLGCSCEKTRLSNEYLKAFATFSSGSFSSENITSQYPFTGKGYTCDYNAKNSTYFGVTEFVLRENRTVYIRRMLSTKDYISSITD